METAIYNDKPQNQKKPRKEEEPARAAGSVTCDDASSVEAMSEVMVRVVRIPANPRLLVCELQESGSRVLVRVPKMNAFFRKGMTFAAEPASSEGEPWNYSGKPPRFPGRW
jgi:hypothetical protein